MIKISDVRIVKSGDIVVCTNDFYYESHGPWWPDEYINEMCKVFKIYEKTNLISVNPLNQIRGRSAYNRTPDWFQSSSQGFYLMKPNKLLRLLFE